MSATYTFHSLDSMEKCPKCEEPLYVDGPGIVKCTTCDFTEDSF